MAAMPEDFLMPEQGELMPGCRYATGYNFRSCRYFIYTDPIMASLLEYLDLATSSIGIVGQTSTRTTPRYCKINVPTVACEPT